MSSKTYECNLKFAREAESNFKIVVFMCRLYDRGCKWDGLSAFRHIRCLRRPVIPDEKTQMTPIVRAAELCSKPDCNASTDGRIFENAFL
jgi:hypothetical protein